MDSCHLFNFIFGPRRATSELRKCFSASSGRKHKAQTASKNQNLPARNNDDSHPELSSPSSSSTAHSVPPSSPIKQLQSKLQSLSARAKAAACSTQLHAATQQQNSTLDVNVTADEQFTALKLKDNDAIDDKHQESDGSVYKAYLVCSDQLDATTTNICAPTVYADCRAENVTNITIDNKPQSNNSYTIDWDHASNCSIDNVNAVNTSISKFETQATYKHDDAVIRKQPEACSRKIPHFILYEKEASLKNGSDEKNIASATIYNLVQDCSDGNTNRRLRMKSAIEGHELDLNGNYQTQALIEQQNQKHSHPHSPSHHQTIARKNSVKDIIKSIESGERIYCNEHNIGSGQKKKATDDLTNCTNKAEETALQQSNNLKLSSKPITLVKPLPPKTPPKTNKARFIKLQLSLNKPIDTDQLFQDDSFLKKFFQYLEPLDRCAAAQVCKKWRNLLYSDQSYWSDLVNVIDCAQLRREHLIECIRNTLSSSKVKQQLIFNKDNGYSLNSNQNELDELWRIQEMCARTAFKDYYSYSNESTKGVPNQTIEQNNIVLENRQSLTTSKSSSIPSQISSRLSSVSLSSLLSPLSESSKIDSLKEKIYNSLEDRGFDAICLLGASDDDIDDLLSRLPVNAFNRIKTIKLSNCFVSNQELSILTSKFNNVCSLELTGCNLISDSIDLKLMPNLKKLMISDCINIGDKIAVELIPIMRKLHELVLQSYHVTDYFLEAIVMNSDVSRLRVLDIQNCKEVTNQTLILIAKNFTNLWSLSLSGLTNITDVGVETIAERLKRLSKLDISWCPRLTDVSLECIAFELNDCLRKVIIDRNVNFSNQGLSNLAAMANLKSIYLRWCTNITDQGFKAVVENGNINYISIAGCYQITARSLLCLINSNFKELELTNVPAATSEFVEYLRCKKPNCTIIY